MIMLIIDKVLLLKTILTKLLYCILLIIETLLLENQSHVVLTNMSLPTCMKKYMKNNFPKT